MGQLSNKTFLGGLDRDSDPRYVNQQDLIDAINVRFSYTDQDSEGSIETIRGNTSIDVPFPSGVTFNRCIGAHEDLDTRKIYFFTFSQVNSSGSCIFEYDQNSQTNTLILSDATIDGPEPVLNFSAENLINDVDVIDGILYWNDTFNPPRKINIERALTGGYPVPFIEQYVEAVQYQPLFAPTAFYGTNTALLTNNLRGKLFQFRISYLYRDGEESATSATSKLPIPTSSNANFDENLSRFQGGPDNLNKNNFLTVRFDTGTSFVDKINLYVRIGNVNDWYLVETLDKVADSIPDNIIFDYEFFNDRTLLAVDQELINRPFDDLPRLANSQEFIDGNRLAYGGTTTGYDNIDDIDVTVTPVYELIGGTGSATNSNPGTLRKTLKRNSDYGVGLIYYDDAGRSTFVQDAGRTRIQSVFETPSFRGEVGLDLTIRHTVPTHFTSYQVVITEALSIQNFITWRIDPGRITVDASTDNIVVSLDDLQDFNNLTATDALTYSFTKGDRFRVIYGDEGGTIPGAAFFLITEPVDLEIISYDEATNSIMLPNNGSIEDIFFEPPGTGGGLGVSSNHITAEIYTPRLEQFQNLYYEIGEKLRIFDGRHQGNVSTQTATTPAIYSLRNIGDVYLRGRIVFVSVTDFFWPIAESRSYSDYYFSQMWDRGKANVIDADQGQYFRPATVSYSLPFIFETEVNGLSTFLSANFRDYDQRWGSIQRLYSEDKRIIMFQELKVSQVLVNENILFDTDNTPAGTVGQQVSVLNNNTYYAGEFGIGTHPESFAVYGRVKYFVDAPRGAVLRLSQDGITKISDYKTHNLFTEQLKGVEESDGIYYIHGQYDIRFDEYVLAVARVNIDPPPGGVVPAPTFSITIGFSERKNRWISRYSYEPEYMVQNGTDLMTFRTGINYEHNNSEVYNTFYGVTTAPAIRFSVNDAAQFVKAWQSITIKGTEPWAVNLTNEPGQVSSLLETDFVNREDRFYASFLRDENTPNITDPLIQGDQLRSDYLLVVLVKQTNTTTYQRLFMVTTQFRGSTLLK